MEALRANPAGVECIPIVPTVTQPAVILAGYPITERAADARARFVNALCVTDIGLKLGISDGGSDCRENHRVPGFQCRSNLQLTQIVPPWGADPGQIRVATRYPRDLARPGAGVVQRQV